MFAAGQYWIFGANGEKIWCLRDCFATLGLVGLMGICCFVIIFCGLKTFRKMIEVQGSMSKQTAALNKQLFLTLTLQTLLPFILMYGPVGLIFFAPLFEWNLQLFVSSAGATTAIYPAFEPLIVIFCISLFRNAVFPCTRSKVTTSSGAFSSAL
ncbi:G protein-coupled receptor [Caenorhabditis elegans]|nr:G protein-coupled receptor [Caenorhabditis elegans]CTQ86751.1 G protein-coupled receptor [Caenorhabditis elegans]|eukprot:NP_001300052.1 Seven TM Receptor [Caenorhabditis elegans]